MLVTRKVLAVAALAAASGVAQAPAPITFQRLQSPGRSGAAGTQITNNGGAALTAFAVSSLSVTSYRSPVRLPAVVIYDVVWQRSWQPVLPGQQEILPVGIGSDPARPAPTVVAAVFEDGTSWGDPKWVETIAAHRAALLKRLPESIADLQQGLALGTSRDALAGQLQDTFDSDLAAASDPGDKMAIRFSRRVALDNVRNATAPLPQLLRHEIDQLNLAITRLRSLGNVQ